MGLGGTGSGPGPPKLQKKKKKKRYFLSIGPSPKKIWPLNPPQIESWIRPYTRNRLYILFVFLQKLCDFKIIIKFVINHILLSFDLVIILNTTLGQMRTIMQQQGQREGSRGHLPSLNSSKFSLPLVKKNKKNYAIIMDLCLPSETL